MHMNGYWKKTPFVWVESVVVEKYVLMLTSYAYGLWAKQHYQNDYFERWGSKQLSKGRLSHGENLQYFLFPKRQIHEPNPGENLRSNMQSLCQSRCRYIGLLFFFTHWGLSYLWSVAQILGNHILAYKQNQPKIINLYFASTIWYV